MILLINEENSRAIQANESFARASCCLQEYHFKDLQFVCKH